MLASPKGAEAQEGKKGPRIALVFANAPEAAITGPNPRVAGARVFLEQMRELGWVDGQNITIERRSTEGKPERLAALAEELRGLRVELLVLSAGREPILAMKQAIGSTPLIWLGVHPDWLVQVGLAKSLARPGGTVTGLTSTTGNELLAKRLQLLKEAIPRVSRVAYLTTTLPVPSEVEIAARALSLTLLPAEVTAPEGLDQAFATMRQKGADAVVLGEGWFFQGHSRRLAELALRERLAAMYRDRVFTKDGALMSYGIDWVDIFRRAPAYVDKILKGAKPGDLPIEQPTKFELVINLKTAKALGLTIRQALLSRADEIMQ
jgi:putative ABC transport system substrate-binding protein